MEGFENNGSQNGGNHDIISTDILKHVFNFDTETKNNLMNIVQYLVILIIPLKLVNDLIEYLFENNDYLNKNFLIILAECLFEIIITIVTILLIHRFITYIPTYSGTPYNNINLLQIALLFTFYNIRKNERFKNKFHHVVNKINQEIYPKYEKNQSVVLNKQNNLQNNLQNNVQYLPQQPNINIEQNNIPNLASLEHRAVEQSVNRNNNNIPPELIPQQTQQPSENNFKETIFNDLTKEPIAANDGNSGGNFSSW